MESDPSEEGSYRPEEEEIGSHAPVYSQGWDKREESLHGAAGRAQQAFLEQMTQTLRQFTWATAYTAVPTRKVEKIWGHRLYG